ncbi:hypothetical protein BDY19DRAFT_993776 [Irpex rosettiformis]|uniref:Uncharacterized protein n=1 Tax=Irpex rosettiformis TaxID=378272 RepID=A0ACB8U3X0_9APHY|nr:hypothetical protein BDY19DRAFT_993776 [Irpex rosettiformis]
MAGNKGKSREAREPPTRRRQSRSRHGESSDDEDMERGRSESRGYGNDSRSRSHQRDRDDGSRRRRRPRSLSWTFARQIGALTHSERCTKCQVWVAHRATAHLGKSFLDAQAEEEKYWAGWVHDWEDGWRRQHSPSLKRRQRSPSPPRKRARQDSSSMEKPAEAVPTAQEERIHYLENVAELLRRQLLAEGITTNNTWSDRARDETQDELLTQCSTYECKSVPRSQDEPEYWEDSEDDYEDSERRKKKRRKECLKKGVWKSRTTTSSSRSMNSAERNAARPGRRPAPPLEERFEDFHPQPGPFHRNQGGSSSTVIHNQWHQTTQGYTSRPSLEGRMGGQDMGQPLAKVAPGPPETGTARVINPSRPPCNTSVQLSTGMLDANLVGPHLVHHHYLEERDTERRVIPLNDTYPGRYRIVYGVVLDLGRPFPPKPPTRYSRNPITGYYWSQAELEAYPRGFPGFPAECPPTWEAGQGGRRIIPYNHAVMDTMDNSTELMQRFENPGGVGAARWKAPTSPEEVQLLRDIATRAANSRALAHYGRLVDEAGRVGAANRSPAQQALVANRGDRPLWAEYKPPKSRGQKSRARQKRIAQTPQLAPVVKTADAIIPPIMEAVGETATEHKGDEDLEMREVAPNATNEEGVISEALSNQEMESSDLTDEELLDFEG